MVRRKCASKDNNADEGGKTQGLVLKFSKPTAAMNSPHPSLAFHKHIEWNH